jgi:hypothetical protein
MSMSTYNDNSFEFGFNKINKTIKSLKEGLDPENLAYWYKRIEERTIEIVPTHLKDKIHFRQDRILWMKFKIDISKRAVPYVIQVIEEYIPLMPYSTSLYFQKVQHIMIDEMNKELC